MSYTRVIPRDLFNESKLLKSLGRLALLHHEGRTPPFMIVESDGGSFEIDQNQDDGGLFVSSGLKVFCEYDGEQTELDLRSNYNDKSNFSLVCYNCDDCVDVFTEHGELTEEFKMLIAKIGLHLMEST